jgi:hypothetical protein
MRFVLRVIAFILALSLTPAFSQTLNRSARISDALPGSSSTFDLPNAPAPRALDGANLAGPDFATPLVQPVGTASATDSTVSRPAFIEATRMSFSPSAYMLVGMSSLAAEAQNVHPTLGKGMPGFTAYYWRGFVDRTDGNYLVTFALPHVFHEDEHFRVMQHGRKFYRLVYAGSRVFIARDYRNGKTINAAELLGRGAAQAISLTYYPGQDRSADVFAERYGYALLGDAMTNVFREFRADLETHVLHHRL